MRKYLLQFLMILAVATPLALAGCSQGGDEHPGEAAGSQSSQPTDAGTTGTTSEHPSNDAGSQAPSDDLGGSSEHPGSGE